MALEPDNDHVSHADKIVLVTGATGRQGGAVVRHMLPRGWKLRALTRNPDSVVAQDLARRGIEVMRGDLEDLTSLDRAVRGAYGVYSVQDFWSVGARREVQQGRFRLSASPLGRSFTRCSAGSITPVSTRTLKGSAGAFPKSIFGP